MENPESFRRSLLPWPVELAVGAWAMLLYRVRVHGRENIPEEGGVLLVANHLSYVDAVLLQIACPRRLRFVAHERFRSHWFFKLAIRLGGVITISPGKSLGSTRRIVEALCAGEAVCVFPEGHVSRTGELMGLKRGFEVMARKAGVPVVPVAHDGIWGSVFSFSGKRYLFKSPRLMPTTVCVCVGAPLPAEEATAERVRRELLDLGATAFGERPVLRRNLAHELARALAKRPHHTDVVDRTAERREVSAARLLAASAALSRRIRKTIPESRVGIVLPPGAGAAIANLAVLFAGKIPVNLNFTAGSAANLSCMARAGIGAVISARVMRAKVPGFPWPERMLDLREEIAAAGKPRLLLWLAAAWTVPNQLMPVLLGLSNRGGDREAALLFTSGSAGDPKGVVLTHRNILANCWQIASTSVLPDTTRLVACLPMFHSFGFTVTLCYTLLRGCRVITVPSPLDTRGVVDAVRQEEATVLIGTPTFLRPVLRKAGPGELRSLELVVSGAEKLPAELYSAFLDKFHIEILQGYGLTETTPVTNVNQPDPPRSSQASVYQEGKRAGSVGRLLPGLTARIVHPDTWAELPATATGMLLLRGANVFGGYLDAPEKTREVFRDGWFVTGDLGRFDDEGFLFIEGRLSRFSKIGGEMVPHGTVEQALLDGFGWEQLEAPKVCVVGVTDAAKGESLAVLTTEAVTAVAVREKLEAAGLPNLWVPKTVLHVSAIPILGTGKVDLKACRELAAAARG